MADSTQQTDDIEALLGDFLPFAERMLLEHQEFLPFGGYTKMSGEIVWEGAQNGEEMPLSIDLINILNDKHRELAEAREIRACAIFYDIRIVPPNRQEKQDAICACVDHSSGYTASIIYPYTLSPAGELAVDPRYVIPGTASIFPRANA